MKTFKEHLESIEEGIEIGKSYDIPQFDAGSNRKAKQTVKVVDYIKKPGSKDIVVYTNKKGKEKKMPAGQFKKLMKEEMDPRDHVTARGDKFLVVGADGSTIKMFKDKAKADQWAIDNHDMLMAVK